MNVRSTSNNLSGSSPLHTKASAPEASAASRSSGLPLSTIILSVGRLAWSDHIASPARCAGPGAMRSQSSSTRSGSVNCSCRTSAFASSASPTMSIPNSSSSSNRNAERSATFLSAMNARMILVPHKITYRHQCIVCEYTPKLQRQHPLVGGILSSLRGEDFSWSGDQVVLDGERNRLGAALNLEFGENVADVKLDRRPADRQALGDLPVVAPLDHHCQDLSLTRR